MGIRGIGLLDGGQSGLMVTVSRHISAMRGLYIYICAYKGNE